MPQRLGMGVDALGLAPGPHRGDERALGLARGMPVVGELAGEGGAAELRVRLELLGERCVQRLALARQELRVRRLTQQRVPELVALL